MPRVPYENQPFFLNSALNVHRDWQELDSAPALTTTFALNNATRQPRRRAESLPWSHQTSILKLGSQQNSPQYKPFPIDLPVTHFFQAEPDGDVEMGWHDGLGDVGQPRRMRGHDYYHTT
jgi:hypothetical protein